MAVEEEDEEEEEEDRGGEGVSMASAAIESGKSGRDVRDARDARDAGFLAQMRRSGRSKLGEACASDSSISPAQELIRLAAFAVL